MLKITIRLTSRALLLMAFQCDDEVESQLEFNTYKVNLTANSPLSLNDTLWIKGRISSMIFDGAINDSIFNDNLGYVGNQFSIYKFMEPTPIANCKDAIDQFELIIDTGTYRFLPSCENAQISASPQLSIDQTQYAYRIGLKPLTTGDYLINWDYIDSVFIQNENRNEALAENYPIANMPNTLGLEKCGITSSLDLNNTDRVFLFRVE